MTISLIWAQSQNGVIGHKGGIPWSLPEDLKHFKQVTMGKPVVMGRKTFESIGRPLPGRNNIVVTSREDYGQHGIAVINNLHDFLPAWSNLDTEVMIIGGQSVYESALPFASKIYKTLIFKDFDGDTFAPSDLLKQGFHVKAFTSHVSISSGLGYTLTELCR